MTLDTDRLTAGQAADECGVSRQTVQSWYNEGLDRQPTRTQVMYFLAHRQGYAAGSERERLARAQAEKFELENARRRGQLMLVEHVVSIFNSLAADLAGRLDGLPGRIANEFAGITDPAIIRARALEETRGIRAGVAEYLRKLVSGPAPVSSGDDTGSAAGKKPKRVGRRKKNTPRRKRRAGTVEE